MKQLLPWFSALAILVVIFGTVYVTVQQSQRNEANMPQIQIAENTATNLNNGYIPGVNVEDGMVDLKTNLATFTIIYDKSGKVRASSAILNGKVPQAPIGILKAASGEDYHAVTWEPAKDVRIAAVTVASKNYYVLTGRSLTEVEKNETKTLQLALLGGMISMILLGVWFIVNSSSSENY